MYLQAVSAAHISYHTFFLHSFAFAIIIKGLGWLKAYNAPLQNQYHIVEIQGKLIIIRKYYIKHFMKFFIFKNDKHNKTSKLIYFIFRKTTT